MSCMAFRESACSTYNSNPFIVARQNRCEYRLENPSRRPVCKVDVDGCYITNGRRCDYLLIDCQQHNAFFVELKGTHLLDAVQQIIDTLQKLLNSLQDCNVFARIVCTRVSVPNIQNNPKILRLQRLLRKHGGTLTNASRHLSESLDNPH